MRRSWRWPWQKPPVQPIRPPKAAGTRAPSNIEAIDFSKPHDFHFQLRYDTNSIQVFERCILVGFTTPMEDNQSAGGYEEYAHNRWIVLQRPDGRRIYIPRDKLMYIEDSMAFETSGLSKKSEK
jgi:hypothetical protein